MGAKDKSKGDSMVVADAGNVNMIDRIPDEEFSLDQFQRVTDTSALIERVTQNHLDWAQENGLIGEKLYVLKPGDVVRGRFAGEGPPVVLANRKQVNKETGEIGPPVVKTWRFQHESGNFVRILSSYQLDREMPEIPVGALVQVIHGGQRETGTGQRVNDMVIQYPRTNKLLEAMRSEEDGKRVLEAKTA